MSVDCALRRRVRSAASIVTAKAGCREAPSSDTIGDRATTLSIEKGSGERKTAAGGRFKKMGLTRVERQPYGFAFVDLGPLAKKRDDLGRAGMRDDMRLRTRRLDKGNGAGQSADRIETDMLGPNPEDHIASRESPSGLANRHGRAAREGEPRAIPAFDRSFKQIHRRRSEEGRDE